MRRKISMLLGVALTLMISTAMISSAQAGISGITWIGPKVMQDTDHFYDASVAAYETDTDWSLSVVIYGSLTTGVNVSKIRVWFDWGTSYNYTYPYPLPQVPYLESRAFTVSNTTPTTTSASNMFPHTYTVYVEYAKNTSTREPGAGSPFSYSWASLGYKFAVYSADQAAAMNSEARYNNLYSSYSSGYFSSAVAVSLRSQAILEDSDGDGFYNIGDFANAKTSYAAAVSKFEQAIEAQDAYSATNQEVTLNNNNATGTAMLTSANADLKQAAAAQTEADAAMVTANATKTQADAALTNAYGWLYIGIGFAVGWTLMGIGVVIYALRKPKPPA